MLVATASISVSVNQQWMFHGSSIFNRTVHKWSTSINGKTYTSKTCREYIIWLHHLTLCALRSKWKIMRGQLHYAAPLWNYFCGRTLVLCMVSCCWNIMTSSSWLSSPVARPFRTINMPKLPRIASYFINRGLAELSHSSHHHRLKFVRERMERCRRFSSGL